MSKIKDRFSEHKLLTIFIISMISLMVLGSYKLYYDGEHPSPETIQWNEEYKKTWDLILSDKVTCEDLQKLRLDYIKGERGAMNNYQLQSEVRSIYNAMGCGTTWNYWD